MAYQYKDVDIYQDRTTTEKFANALEGVPIIGGLAKIPDLYSKGEYVKVTQELNKGVGQLYVANELFTMLGYRQKLTNAFNRNISTPFNKRFPINDNNLYATPIEVKGNTYIYDPLNPTYTKSGDRYDYRKIDKPNKLYDELDERYKKLTKPNTSISEDRQYYEQFANYSNIQEPLKKRSIFGDVKLSNIESFGINVSFGRNAPKPMPKPIELSNMPEPISRPVTNRMSGDIETIYGQAREPSTVKRTLPFERERLMAKENVTQLTSDIKEKVTKKFYPTQRQYTKIIDNDYETPKINLFPRDYEVDFESLGKPRINPKVDELEKRAYRKQQVKKLFYSTSFPKQTNKKGELYSGSFYTELV